MAIPGTIKIIIPTLHITGTHAKYFGQDAAFNLELVK